jgi:hypothetical protein
MNAIHFKSPLRRSHISKRSDVLRGAPVWRCSRVRRQTPQNAPAAPLRRRCRFSCGVGKPIPFDSRLASGRLPRAVCMTVGQFDSFEQDTGRSASARCYTFEDGDWREREDRSWHNLGFEQERSHPVVRVTSDDAKAYVNRVAKEMGKPYHLLSEAEF